MPGRVTGPSLAAMRHKLTVTLIFSTLAVLGGSMSFGSSDAYAAVESVRNAAEIGLPGNGNASSYPSTINMPAMEGRVIGATVTFHGFVHGSAQSVHALLVAPDGKKSMLMSGSCAVNQPSTLLIFSDDGLQKLPPYGPCDKIVYRPTENSLPGFGGFGFAAPPGPYTGNMNNFLGATAQGAWKLYIKGYGGASSGKIAGGWSLTLQTAPVDAVVPGPAGSYTGTASSYPLTRSVSGLSGLITDVNVSVPAVFHQNAADLEMMLQSPNGDRAILMSDRCAGDVRYETWRFDDESTNFMKVEEPCASGIYKPVGVTDQRFPEMVNPVGVPMPLSNFDLTEPNGEWRLYVFDDHPGDDKAGLFLNRFNVEIETRPKAALQFASPTLELTEGETGELTVTRSAGTAQTARATVYFTALPGTAGTEDFNRLTQSVEFAPGETEKKVKLEAIADAVNDPDETFSVRFGFISGDAAPTSTTPVTVTIREAPPAGGGDSGGPVTGGGQTGDGQAPDLVAPSIGELTLAPRRFRVAARSTATVARVRRGTRIRYSLSEAAAVELRFQRAVRNRRTGKRRWVAVGRLHRTGSAGANRVAFSGRIGRRALRPGAYRLIVRATDAAGNSAKAKPRALRVLR